MLGVRALLLISLAGVWTGRLAAEDCNGNGIEDARDIAPGRLAFESESRYATLGPSVSIAAADLDSDGLPDVVTADIDANGTASLTLLMNEGNRSFRPPAGLMPRQRAERILPADIDGDGDPDLILGTANPAVLLNRGDGTWGQKAVSIDPIFSLEAIDFDRDGQLDLLGLWDPAPDGTVTIVLVRNGGEAFDPLRILLRVKGAREIAAGDLDGDGAPDVAVTMSFEVLVLGQEAGNQLSERQRIVIGQDPFLLRLEDLDGDGRLDLVTGNVTQVFLGGIGSVSLALNFRDGGFREARNFAVEGGPATLAIADLDADSLPDLASASRDATTISLLLNRGGGQFTRPSTLSLGRGDPSLAAADLDGDGKIDLLASHPQSSHVSVFWGEGGARFRSRASVPLNDLPGETLLADLDGDGDLDVATDLHGPCCTNGIGVVVVENQGGLLRKALPPFERVGAPLAAGDLDGDGLVDLVAGTQALQSVTVFSHRGGTSLPQETSELVIGYTPHSLAICDIDGDGDLDLVAGTLDSNGDAPHLMVLDEDAEGELQVKAEAKLPIRPVSLISADLDADGDVDLAWTDRASAWGILENRGSFPLSLGRKVADDEPSSLAVADLDHDGLMDLVVGHALSSWLSVLLGAQVSLPVPPRSVQGGAGPAAVVAADLDGDGSVDIASVNRISGDLSVLRNDGKAWFAERSDWGAGVGPVGLAAGDLDGDGRPDLVIASSGAGSGAELSILRNITPRPHSLDRDGDGVPDECGAAAFHRGDVDGDGRAGIADPIALLGFLFGGGSTPDCLDAADFQDDGAIDITDPVLLLGYLFLGGAPPAPPGPPGAPCGADPAGPNATQSLGCSSYPSCSAPGG